MTSLEITKKFHEVIINSPEPDEITLESMKNPRFCYVLLLNSHLSNPLRRLPATGHPAGPATPRRRRAAATSWKPLGSQRPRRPPRSGR